MQFIYCVILFLASSLVATRRAHKRDQETQVQETDTQTESVASQPIDKGGQSPGPQGSRGPRAM